MSLLKRLANRGSDSPILGKGQINSMVSRLR